MRRMLLAALLVVLAVPSVALAWTWPTDGIVLRPFLFGSNPYAGGLHRGVDLAGDAGSPVRAPAGGSVSFAGTVPGGGKTLTIHSGEYAVTVQQLGSLGVGRGADVGEGGVVGSVGPDGYVYLSVRVAAQAQGYLDPLTLLPPRLPALSSADPAEVTPDAAPSADAAASPPQAASPPPAPPADPVPSPAGAAPSADTSAVPQVTEPVTPAEAVVVAPALPATPEIVQPLPAEEPTPAQPQADPESVPAPPLPSEPPLSVTGAGLGVMRGTPPATSASVRPASVPEPAPLSAAARDLPVKAAPRIAAEVVQSAARRAGAARAALGVRRPSADRHVGLTAGRKEQPSRPLVTLTLLAAATLAGAAAALRLARMISARAGVTVVPVENSAEDPRGAGLAVRVGTAPHRTRGRLRRPVGHLCALPPTAGRRRPDGERDGRARYADHGGRGPGERLAA